jgi:TonB family protein
MLEQSYPPALRDAGVQGDSTLMIFLDAQGQIRDVRLTRSSGHRDMDVNAAMVARAAQFHPMIAGTCSVPSLFQIPIGYRVQAEPAGRS